MSTRESQLCCRPQARQNCQYLWYIRVLTDRAIVVAAFAVGADDAHVWSCFRAVALTVTSLQGNYDMAEAVRGLSSSPSGKFPLTKAELP